jgi:hypothetical protein
VATKTKSLAQGSLWDCPRCGTHELVYTSSYAGRSYTCNRCRHQFRDRLGMNEWPSMPPGWAREEPTHPHLAAEGLVTADSAGPFVDRTFGEPESLHRSPPLEQQLQQIYEEVRIGIQEAPMSTQSRTCIEEEFLWCHEPARNYDKGYVSRVYERGDGKFVHRYGWGRRFSTYQYKETVHSVRTLALQEHRDKIYEKRSQSSSKGQYHTCTHSDLGLQREMGSFSALLNAPAGAPPVTAIPPAVQLHGGVDPALFNRTHMPPVQLSLQAARNAAHQQFGESLGVGLVSAIQAIQFGAQQGAFPKASLDQLQRELDRLAGVLSITRTQVANRIHIPLPLPATPSAFSHWAEQCRQKQLANLPPWAEVVRAAPAGVEEEGGRAYDFSDWEG